MTNEEQRRIGEIAGRNAATSAIKVGYFAWLGRQVTLCRSLATRNPYAAGYVVGATAVIDAHREAR